MAAGRHDQELDRLFQLPLDEFTVARNAFARQAGADGAAIRELTKPPVAAWAVNQLYWQDRAVYDALTDASEALRKTHKAVLGGRGGDLRAAGRAHDQALDRAVKATMGILTGSGHPASDATRQAIVSTLRALPGDAAPGRLTRTLQPGGFEMLAGLPIAKGSRIAAAPKPPPARAAKPADSGKTKAERQRDAKALAKAKAAAAGAAEALQRAEHEARREEFERARAAREADKAAAAVERARQAVAAAQQALEEADEAARAAGTNRDRAEQRAKEADERRTAAEAQAQAAAKNLEPRTREPVNPRPTSS